jgi:5'-methylthioadenosine phosphorylase
VKGRIGIIGGTVLEASRLFGASRPRVVETPHGAAEVFLGEGYAYVRRHGAGKVPPHMINHKANVWALGRQAKTMVGVGSVGALRMRLRPPRVLVPDDYLDFCSNLTYFDRQRRHVTPGFDREARKSVLRAAKKAGVKAVDGGTYAQTRGPRLETKAEVRMLSDYADVVGMTLASEATLARELGLAYAAVCSVDNLANGVGAGSLDYASIASASAGNAAAVEAILARMIGDAR